MDKRLWLAERNAQNAIDMPAKRNIFRWRINRLAASQLDQTSIWAELRAQSQE